MEDLGEGDLVVTEIMQNPDVVTDSNGEWFEIYNATGQTVDLEGLMVSDNESNSFTVSEFTFLDVDQYFVFGRNADQKTNGLLPVDYEYSGFDLGNGEDEIYLDSSKLRIDAVEFDDGATFPDPTGASMSLDPAHTDADDNDDGANWCEATSAYGKGDLGTPASVNDSCGAADADGDGYDSIDAGGDDCDDNDANTYPGAAADEPDPKGCYTDADGDGFGSDSPAKGVDVGSDCDDGDATVNPAGSEIIGDKIDNNCNGEVDEGEDTAHPPHTGDTGEPPHTGETGEPPHTGETGGPIDTGDSDSVQNLGAGDLVITEVMQNPDAVSDSNGEWFEIYNASGVDVDLSGLVVSDQGTNSFTVANTLMISAGDYLVFGNNDDTSTNGGVTVDYLFSASDMALGNGTDELVLANNAGTIDEIIWDNGSTFPDPTGASMSLDPSSTDATSNDDGGNWCAATTSYGDGDLGTPGSSNDTCVPDTGLDTGTAALTVEELVEGDLVITEIMQNPDAVSDGSGEWFEIWNASGYLADLNGLVVSDSGSDSFTVSGSLLIDDSEYLVFGNNSDLKTNGGVTVDYAFSSSDMSLGNGFDEIVLANSSVTIDEVAYNDGKTYPDPTGASMTLDMVFYDTTSNDDGFTWCEAATSYGSGDLGTPGEDNDSCAGGGGTDADGDGYTDAAEGGDDCDDSDANTYPGAATNEADPSLCMTDADGDGYGDSNPASGVDAGTDCDDGDAAISPAANEVVGDFVDNDCDGDVDEGGDTAEPPDTSPPEETGEPVDTSDTGVALISVEDLTGGELVITEIMQNPAAVSDSSGEYFEIFNGSGYQVDLDGMVVSDAGSNSFTVSGELIIEDMGHMVFSLNDDAKTNGGVTVDYLYASGDMSLGNSSDELILSNSSVTIDEVAWDNGKTFPDPSGASMNLDTFSYDATFNDDGGYWCEASSSFGSGDLGTPGDINDSCGIATDVDGDGYDSLKSGGTDCDDFDPGVNPGAKEVAGDGVDSNCDGADDT